LKVVELGELLADDLTKECAMSIVLQTEPMPLAMDEYGTIRVGNTRVTLDTIVTAYKQGESPEVIADQYPTLSLADIFAAITYYLRHREEVEEYLAERQQRGEEIRRKHEARFSQSGLKEELLARRDASRK
jgi:uncharacterized protein (DUF433 family)